MTKIRTARKNQIRDSKPGGPTPTNATPRSKTQSSRSSNKARLGKGGTMLTGLGGTQSRLGDAG